MKFLEGLKELLESKFDLPTKKYKIVNEKLEKYFISNVEYKIQTEKADIYNLIGLIYDWYFKQIDAYCELNKITNRLKLLDLSSEQLRKIFDNSKFLETIENKITQRQFANYKNKSDYITEVQNCVMYDIIEQKGCTYGPVNGLIFAHMNELDISIPMQYAVTD